MIEHVFVADEVSFRYAIGLAAFGHYDAAIRLAPWMFGTWNKAFASMRSVVKFSLKP